MIVWSSSNHGDTVQKMCRQMVININRFYCWDIPIIIRMER